MEITVQELFFQECEVAQISIFKTIDKDIDLSNEEKEKIKEVFLEAFEWIKKDFGVPDQNEKLIGDVCGAAIFMEVAKRVEERYNKKNDN
jgi:hypothetical protein